MTLAANQATTQNLPLATIPFAVTSVTPANGTQVVPLDSPVVVQFNRAVSSASLTSVSVQLLEGTTPVDAVLVRSGSGVSLYPRTLKSKTTYTVALSTGITDLYGNPLSAPVTANFTTKSLVPPTIPPAGQITVSFPNANGLVTISATQGTIATENHLDLFNATTGMTVSVDLQGNGSFTGQIKAELGDELRLLIRDPSGNVTFADPGPYRDADGKTLVDKKGGTVRGDENVALILPPEALSIPQILTVEPITEATLPAPIPSGFTFAGAVNIDTLGALLKSEAKLSIPLPDNVPTDVHPFLVTPVEIDGQTEYAVVTTAKIENGKIITATPPFDGILGFGLYAFVFSPPAKVPVVITGHVYQEGNDNNVYDPENVTTLSTGQTRTDKGIQRAIVSASVANGTEYPRIVAFTDAEGKYAITSFVDVTQYDYTASLLNFELKATDPLTHFTRTIGVGDYFTATRRGLANDVNIQLGNVADISQDHQPPTLQISLRGDGLIAGVAKTGVPVRIQVTAADNIAIDPSTLLITLDNVRQQSSAVSSGTYEIPPFTPSEPPTAHVVFASVKDLAGNIQTKTLTFQTFIPGSQAISRPGERPRLIEAGVFPENNSMGVNTFEQIRIPFSEPIANANAAGGIFLREQGGAVVSTDMIQSLEGGYLVKLIPTGNLKFGTKYEIVVGSMLIDNDSEVIENPQTLTFETLPLAQIAQVNLNDAKDLAIQDNLMYVANGDEGLAIYDIQDPSHPQLLSTLPVNGKAYGVALSPKDDPSVSRITFYQEATGTPVYKIAAVVAYLPSTGFGVIRIVSVDDPRAPRVIGTGILTADFAGVPFRVVIIDKYAYVATLLTGIQIVDIQKAIDPHAVGANILAGSIDTRAQDGSAAYPFDVKAIDVKTGDNQMISHLISITEKELITANAQDPISASLILGRLPVSGGFRLEVAGGYAYTDGQGNQVTKDLAFVVAGQQLLIVDVTNLGNPTLLSSLPFQDRITGVTVSAENHLLFLANGMAGLKVVDIQNPLSPREIGTFQGTGPMGRMAVNGSNVFGSAGSGGVKIIQFDPPTIKLLDELGIADMVGVVTDGASKLRIRVDNVTPNVKVKLILEPGNPNADKNEVGRLFGGDCPNQEGCLEVNAISTDQGVLNGIVYEAPSVFVRRNRPEDQNKIYREVKLTAKVISESSRPSEKNIRVKRPPLLLVHGIWSNADAWNELDRLINIDKQFTILEPDYSQPPYGNAAHFNSNAPIIGEYIEKALRKMLEQRYIASKVDIVAHSMGALITRVYCGQVGDTVCTKQIHKLISLDSPHWGTPIAQHLVALRDRPNPSGSERWLLKTIQTVQCNETQQICRPINQGAVDDLQYGNSTIRQVPVTSLPTHTIVGETATSSLGESWTSWGLWEVLIAVHPNHLAPDQSFISSSAQCVQVFTCTPVFSGPNDRIVQSDSQRAGLLDGVTSHLCNTTDHISINQNIGHCGIGYTVVDRIKELLEKDANDSLVFSRGIQGVP